MARAVNIGGQSGMLQFIRSNKYSRDACSSKHAALQIKPNATPKTWYAQSLRDIDGIIVLLGTFTYTTESGSVSCGPGDTYELAVGVPHAEAAGPDGVRYLGVKSY